jgi:hypothetical protein
VNGKPWFDWYKWRNKYWDTKWNAYEQDTYTGDPTAVEFEFQTAWSPPMPVIKRLALLNFKIEYRWADEDWGSNCGHAEYDPESKSWSFTYADDMDNPRKFAIELWGYDYDEILKEEEEDK